MLSLLAHLLVVGIIIYASFEIGRQHAITEMGRTILDLRRRAFAQAVNEQANADPWPQDKDTLEKAAVRRAILELERR